jgi:hypothetical protein
MMELDCWRPIPSFAGYEVSDIGRVRSLAHTRRGRNGGERSFETKIMKLRQDKQGRAIVALRQNGGRRVVRVSTLVAEAFLGPRPPGMEVCHENGDNLNNHPWNLRYDTHQNNCRDRIIHGTQRNQYTTTI